MLGRRLRAAAVVLAAGASSRLGRPKQIVCVRGVPLVRIAARAARASACALVGVVVGAHEAATRRALEGVDVTILQNAAWEEGMASSVRLAAAWAQERECDALVLVLCDQPRLRARHIDRLLAAHLATSAPVASRFQGVLGVPAVFGASSFPELLELRGDEGERRLLRGTPRASAIDWSDGAGDMDAEADLTDSSRV
jgi:CTP:molybdopterin cytidylyltransferase MocA